MIAVLGGLAVLVYPAPMTSLPRCATPSRVEQSASMQ